MAGGTRVRRGVGTATQSNLGGMSSEVEYYSRDVYEQYGLDRGAFGMLTLENIGQVMGTAVAEGELSEVIEEFNEEYNESLANLQVGTLECGYRYNVAWNVATGSFKALLNDTVIYPNGPPNVFSGLNIGSSPTGYARHPMSMFSISPAGDLEALYDSHGAELNAWFIQGGGPASQIEAREQSSAQLEWFAPFEPTNVKSTLRYVNNPSQWGDAATNTSELIAEAVQQGYPIGR